MKKRVLISAGFLLLVFVSAALAYDFLRPLNTAVRSFVGANLYKPFYYIAMILHYLFETELATVQTLLWGAVIFFLYRSKSGALLFVGSVLVQSIAVSILKVAIGIQRPPQEYFGVLYHTFSYPSGHTATSATMAIMLAWIFLSKLKRSEGWMIAAAYAVLALATAYSRMYLDVHWMLDIIGGLALGGAISLVFIAAGQLYKTNRSNNT